MTHAAYQMAQPGGIADITSAQFDRVMRTNLYATFWLSKGALERMEEGGASSTPPPSRVPAPHQSCWTMP